MNINKLKASSDRLLEAWWKSVVNRLEAETPGMMSPSVEYNVHVETMSIVR